MYCPKSMTRMPSSAPVIRRPLVSAPHRLVGRRLGSTQPAQTEVDGFTIGRSWCMRITPKHRGLRTVLEEGHEVAGELREAEPNETSRAFSARLSRSSGRRVSTHGTRPLPGVLLTDRAPAGSPVTGLLMGCRARFGVST